MRTTQANANQAAAHQTASPNRRVMPESQARMAVAARGNASQMSGGPPANPGSNVCVRPDSVQQNLGNQSLLRNLPSSEAPVLRRKCACGGSGEGTCDKCADEEKLRRAAAGPAPASAPPAVHRVLQSPG